MVESAIGPLHVILRVFLLEAVIDFTTKSPLVFCNF